MSRDRETGTVVAIKYLSDEVYRAPGFADRFRGEARMLAAADNDHVAALYEFIEGPESAAIVSELVDGVSLRDVLASGGALDPEAALYVIKSTLLGLSEAHRRGIVHRDLRPENILIDATGRVKVADIGIAARVGRKAPAAGDTRYLAPELWAGQPSTPASDVYAVATMLFECVTGEPPRTRKGKPLGAAARTDADVLAVVPVELPDRIHGLLTRQLSPNVTKRLPNAPAMLDELEMAAYRTFGTRWPETGRARLVSGIAPLIRTRRLHGDPERMAVTDAGRPWPVRTGILIAGALALVVGLAFAAEATGVFASNGHHSTAGPKFTHTPMLTSGPPVPTPAPPGPGVDKVKPSQPAQVRVTGRGQTAISLTWAPSFDNVNVAGYILTRDGRQIGTTSTAAFTDVGLTANTTYGYTVVAFDAAGNLSLASATVQAKTLATADVTAPTVPIGLRSTGHDNTSVWLAWTPSRDKVGVAGYDVFRDGRRIGTVAETSFADTGLGADTTHTYAVRAFDASNNESASSRVLTVTTSTGKDTEHPKQPTDLVATGTSVSSIQLTWTAGSDNTGVTGYEIFRNGAKVGTTTTATTFVDTGLAASTTYAYTVRAYDAAGNPSTDASASGTTQTAPPPPPPPSHPSKTPKVTSIRLDTSEITFPSCTTAIQATIEVDGGATDVGLSYTIDGTTMTTTVFVSRYKTITLADSVDATIIGTASVTVTDPAGGPSDTLAWAPPLLCIPIIPTPPPTVAPTVAPTDTGGGGSSDGPDDATPPN